MSIPDLIDAQAAISKLLLGDYPEMLTLGQVAEVCGFTYGWAYERALRGTLPVDRDGNRTLVKKLEFIGWLAGESKEAVFRAIFSPLPAGEERRDAA